MKCEIGDIVLTKNGTLGVVYDNSRNGKSCAINIVKLGGDSKSAWYDEYEFTVIVPIKESIRKAISIVESPLAQVLKEE